MSANLTDKKYNKYDNKYDKYNKVVLGNLMAKEDWRCADLPRAHTPQTSIGACIRDNNTRAPRVRGSNGRRFCQALPAGVAEGRATGTDRSLPHKALVRSGPHAGATVRTPQQCITGLGPDHMPTITSLLHACWQGVVIAAPLRAGISPIRGVIQWQMPSSL